MPLMRGTDVVNGVDRYWYRWGRSGKKYYFHAHSPISRKMAKDKAMKQARAILAK